MKLHNIISCGESSGVMYSQIILATLTGVDYAFRLNSVIEMYLKFYKKQIKPHQISLSMQAASVENIT